MEGKMLKSKLARIAINCLVGRTMTDEDFETLAYLMRTYEHEVWMENFLAEADKLEGKTAEELEVSA